MSKRPRDPMDPRMAIMLTSPNGYASKLTVTLSKDRTQRSFDDSGIRHKYSRSVHAKPEKRPASAYARMDVSLPVSDANRVSELESELEKLRMENLKLSADLERLGGGNNTNAVEGSVALHQDDSEIAESKDDPIMEGLGLDIRPLQSISHSKLSQDDQDFACNEIENVDKVSENEFWSQRKSVGTVTEAFQRSSTATTAQQLDQVKQIREKQEEKLRNCADYYEEYKIRTDFKHKNSTSNPRDIEILRRTIIVPSRLSPPRKFEQRRPTLFDSRGQEALERARPLSTRSADLKLRMTRDKLGPSFNPWGDDLEALEEERRLLKVLEDEKIRKERQDANIAKQMQQQQQQGLETCLYQNTVDDKDEADEIDSTIPRSIVPQSVDMNERIGRLRERYNSSRRSVSSSRSLSSPDTSRKRSRSLSLNRHRKSITIPEPFSFDRREAEKRKTIAKQRFEQYLAEIRAQEAMECSVQFRASPIPSTTLLPLYEEMVRRKAERSEAIRATSKIMTKARERPFSFTKRDEQMQRSRQEHIERQKEEQLMRFNKPFKANPVPGFVHEKRMEILEKEEQQRHIRMRHRALEQLNRASLPPRMAEHRRRETVSNRKSSSKNRRQKFPFQPQITRDVPNFERLQRQFEQQLSGAKKTIELTKVEPFSFDQTTQKSARLKVLERMIDPGGSRVHGSPPDEPTTTAFLSSIPIYSDSRKPRFLQTTRSMKLRERAMRDSIDKDRRHAELLHSMKKERESRQMDATKRVAPNVPKRNSKYFYRDMEKENRKKMIESMREERIDQRSIKKTSDEMLRHRPFLFEDDLAQSVRQSTIVKVKQMITESGLNAESIIS